MKRFCVKCGIEESIDTPIIDNLCPKCFIEVRGVIKPIDIIEIETCGICGAIRYNGRWFYPPTSEEARSIVKEIISSKIKVVEGIEIASLNIDLERVVGGVVDIVLKVSIHGKASVDIRKAIPVKWRRSICTNCRRRLGKSYTAIVQLRYLNMDSDVHRFIEEISKMFMDFISEIIETGNGFDIKVLDIHTATKIVEIARRRWRYIKIVETYGDVMRRSDGSRYAKKYISLRIINIRPGDYIVISGVPYTVVSIDGDTVRLLNSDGAEETMPMDALIKNYSRFRSRRKGSI